MVDSPPIGPTRTTDDNDELRERKADKPIWLKRVQLEEDFCHQMDQNIVCRRAKDVEHPFVDDFGNHPALPRCPLEGRPLLGWLAAKVIVVYGRFCQIDINAGRMVAFRCSLATGWINPNSSKLELPASSPLAPNECAKWNWRLRKLISFSSLMIVLYLACMSLMFLELYHHYLYDQYAFHLRRLRQAINSQQLLVLADYQKFNLTEEKLEARAAQSRVRAKALGAPYLRATYASETFYLMLLSCSYVTYLNIIIHHKSPWGRFDFCIIRLILNRDNERRNFNRLICEQVNNYIQSSCNFTEAFINRCIELNGLKGLKLDQLARRCELHNLLLDYKRTIRLLKEMCLKGVLQPMSRSDRWIDWLTVNMSCIIIWVMFSGALVYLGGVIVAPYKTELMSTEPMDLVGLSAQNIVWMAALISTCFYVALTVTTGHDELRMMNLLIRDTKNCVQRNAATYRANFLTSEARRWGEPTRPEVGQSTGQKQDQDQDQEGQGCPQEVEKLADRQLDDQRACKLMIDEMNSRLLYVFIHYKIFVAQLKPMQRFFGLICATSLVIVFVVPVVGRLHVAYVTADAKLVTIILGLFCNFLGNLCMVPVCHVHLKCLKVYKALWTLLAHTIETTNCSEQTTIRVYDRHTIWMLRKELHHPDRLANQFATKALGIAFVYPNLIRINFWFSLIILSIMTDVRTDQEEVIGSLTSDPLGIFSLELDV